jgi:hypothetical protein
MWIKLDVSGTGFVEEFLLAPKAWDSTQANRRDLILASGQNLIHGYN